MSDDHPDADPATPTRQPTPGTVTVTPPVPGAETGSTRPYGPIPALGADANRPSVPVAPAPGPPTDEQPAADRRGLRALDIGVPVALMVGTALSRLPNLRRPDAFVFDEVYYALEASDILRRGVEQGPVVHPPLGKWLIAGGIRLFGFTPFGWRSAALVAGCLVVLFTYLAARQVVRGHALPALAGVLVALDGIEFTVGRIAQLDVFVALWVTMGVWLLLAAVRHPEDRRRVRWCSLGAGVAMAMAMGTKWGFALFPIVVCLGVFLVLDLTTPGVRRLRAVPVTVLTLAVLPAVAFVAFHVPWMMQATETTGGSGWCRAHQSLEDCHPSTIDRLGIWKDDQERIFKFHRELRPQNVYAVPAWNWAVLDGPVLLFRKSCYEGTMRPPASLDDGACRGGAPGDRMEIAAIPNPAVWVPAMLALPAALVLSLRRRRADLVGPVLFLMAGALWLPYLLDVTRPWLTEARDSYTFYMAPLVPVAVLALVKVLSEGWLRRLAPVFAVAALAAFAFYYPIWAGIPLDPDGIRLREFWRAW